MVILKMTQSFLVGLLEPKKYDKNSNCFDYPSVTDKKPNCYKFSCNKANDHLFCFFCQNLKRSFNWCSLLQMSKFLLLPACLPTMPSTFLAYSLDGGTQCVAILWQCAPDWTNFSAEEQKRKELECKSEVGRICGQGTKGANQFGRWRNWRFLSRHCCKSAFLSTSRFRLDTFSSGLPFKSASFADKFYADHQFRSTGSFSTCPYSGWSACGYVLYHMLCTSKSRVSYASMHVQLGRCEVFWTSNAKIWKFPLGLHKSLRSRHAALCFRRCADNLHSIQSFEHSV